MGFYTKRVGEYDHDFYVGQRIQWKHDNKIYYVGDDYDEIERWGSGFNPLENYIVTTCGRVLRITEIKPA
jgi:hypothetical protein